MNSLITRAQAFAHEAHDSIGQVRKYTKEPYWVHTDEVAQIVLQTLADENGGAVNQNIAEIVAAAHLHDVIEDVFPVKPEYDLPRIASEFGERVADLVVALTDVYTKEAWPDLNREKRKRAERERIAKTVPEAKTIKLADLISNTQSIVEHDKDFARTYIREKLLLLGSLTDGNPTLLGRASQLALDAAKALDIREYRRPINA